MLSRIALASLALAGVNPANAQEARTREVVRAG